MNKKRNGSKQAFAVWTAEVNWIINTSMTSQPIAGTNLNNVINNQNAALWDG